MRNITVLVVCMSAAIIGLWSQKESEPAAPKEYVGGMKVEVGDELATAAEYRLNEVIRFRNEVVIPALNEAYEKREEIIQMGMEGKAVPGELDKQIKVYLALTEKVKALTDELSKQTDQLFEDFPELNPDSVPKFDPFSTT